VVSRQNADIADTLQLRGVAIATTFWLPSSITLVMWWPETRCLILEWVFRIKLSDKDTV